MARISRSRTKSKSVRSRLAPSRFEPGQTRRPPRRVVRRLERRLKRQLPRRVSYRQNSYRADVRERQARRKTGLRSRLAASAAIKSFAALASYAVPADYEVIEDARTLVQPKRDARVSEVRCKERPDPNRSGPKKGRGGGARPPGTFIPWC